MYKYRVIETVKKVRGTCAAGFKLGDQMVFEGSKIVMERMDRKGVRKAEERSK